jgi:NAD(P)H-dependent flavin oxidoreductase YrpB (nitropropane dioxygenase family)
LRRPRFLAIVSAASLAATLARKSNGRVDGFVVEGPTAGGHNAPPRGALQLTEAGEPVYGERDVVDLAAMRELGLPFWLAGGVGSPDGLARAEAAGAAGIQVGTLFAYCNESGITPEHRERVLEAVIAGEATIHTDPRASPTGYPFKVVELPGDRERAAKRTRICDLGYLRSAVRTAPGKIVYRCPAEPVDAYVAKGGDAADTEGRRCLCNGLTANVGQPQLRESGEEAPLLTSGDDLLSLTTFLRGARSYSAKDVIAYLSS